MKLTCKTLLLITGIALLTLPACKKKNDQPAGVQCLLTHIIYNSTDTFDLTYDAQNRVASYYRPGIKYIYTYNGLTGNTSYDYFDSIYHDKDLFFNADGYVSRMEDDRMIGSTHYKLRTDFTYNSDMQVIWCQQAMLNYSGGSTEYYKDSIIYTNGNPTTVYRFFKVGSSNPYTLSETETITYGTVKNKIGSYVWGLYFPMLSQTPFFNTWIQYFSIIGKGPVNLPTGLHSEYPTSVIVSNRTLDFLEDENGYPTEENNIWSTSGVDNYHFLYECK